MSGDVLSPQESEVAQLTRRQALSVILAAGINGGLLARDLLKISPFAPELSSPPFPGAQESQAGLRKSGEISDEKIEKVFNMAEQRLQRTAEKLPPGKYPYFTDSKGQWEGREGPNGWIGGFFPGSLWIMYKQTGDKKWKKLAEEWTAPLEDRRNDREVGFVIIPSFINGYQATKDERYRQFALSSSADQSKQYNPAIGALGATGSWPGENTGPVFRVFMDNMLSTELLFWASQQPEGKKEWFDMAVQHATTTMKNHVRRDGRIYQDVNFDLTTGEVTDKYSLQGYDRDSTWSRGQAWAIAGFTIAYRETRDKSFLETARKTADYFIDNLPADHVPYWDFEAPDIPDAPKDSSAAAIAASYLLELSTLDPSVSKRQSYFRAGENILMALMSPKYLAERGDALLKHGTQNMNKDSYDTGLVYGDYYFLQALRRYTQISR